MQDYLNYGHVLLTMEQIPTAITQYTTAQKSFKSHEEFISLFEKDIPLLVQQGLGEEEIRIVLDLLAGI